MLGTTDGTATSVSGSLLTWLSFKYRKQRQTCKLQRPLLWCRWNPPALLWTGFSVALSCFWAVCVGCGRVPCFITNRWSLLSWTSWNPLGGFLWAGHPTAAGPGSQQKAGLLIISYICLQKACIQLQRLFLYFCELWASCLWMGMQEKTCSACIIIVQNKLRWHGSLFFPFLKVNTGIYSRGRSCSGSQLIPVAVTSPLLRSLQDTERISSLTISCFLTISLVSYGPTTHLVDRCGLFTGTAVTAAAASISVSDDTAAGRLVFMSFY